MSELEEKFAAAASVIEGAKRILVSGHLSPDGDSLGCMLALVRFLKNAGHEATATADVNALGKLVFLEGVSELLPVRKLKRARRNFDLLIAVDCGSLDRLPPEVRPLGEKLPLVCFDHHVTTTSFGVVTVVDGSASSAGEILWRFAKWQKWPLDTAIAEALWVALVTDSGRFAYASTSPETMLAASDLLHYGVRTALINDLIYATFSRRSMRLKRLAWRSLHIWKNGRVAEVTLTRDDFRQVRGKKADAEDIVEIPRALVGNVVALFFYQIPDRTHETRCSIRTRGNYDATALAVRFGGGGHRKAAGCTIKAPLSVAKRMMRAAVKELLKG